MFGESPCIIYVYNDIFFRTLWSYTAACVGSYNLICKIYLTKINTLNLIDSILNTTRANNRTSVVNL